MSDGIGIDTVIKVALDIPWAVEIVKRVWTRGVLDFTPLGSRKYVYPPSGEEVKEGGGEGGKKVCRHRSSP